MHLGALGDERIIRWSWIDFFPSLFCCKENTMKCVYASNDHGKNGGGYDGNGNDSDKL